jgi:hypothetical protein
MVISVQAGEIPANERALSSIPMKVLTRKAIWRVNHAIRTANRHRCSGREDQGVRVILRQGTRQNSGRNFGIRPASFLEAAAKEPMQLFTKNIGLC